MSFVPGRVAFAPSPVASIAAYRFASPTAASAPTRSAAAHDNPAWRSLHDVVSGVLSSVSVKLEANGETGERLATPDAR